MKLNNKGFAITLVLYGTLVLFLLLIVSLLGILSTYKLRLEKIYPEVTSLSCEIVAETGYQLEQTLKIKSSLSNVTYSWDKSNWSVNNSKENVKSAGTYTGYVKSIDGEEVVKCSLEIVSKTFYQYASCKKGYTDWNSVTEWSGTEQDKTISETRESAEAKGLTKYYSVWSLGSPSVCHSKGFEEGLCYNRYKYTRSCYDTNCGDFGEWSITYVSDICGRKVNTKTMYGVVE